MLRGNCCHTLHSSFDNAEQISPPFAVGPHAVFILKELLFNGSQVVIYFPFERLSSKTESFHDGHTIAT